MEWLLNLEDRGFKLFGDSIVKFRTKLTLDVSKSDSLQPAALKLDGKKVDDELFYIDNKGEDEHKNEEDEKVNRSTNAVFVDAAHAMTSSEKRGRKRKGKNAEKKEKIKFVKYDLHQKSDSAGGRPSLINNDSINYGSEAENPHSDEDTE